MVFKKLMGALGVGGPKVDTVLASPHARPGEFLTGEVRIVGGDHPVEINQVILSLVARVTVEHEGGPDTPGEREFAELVVGGGFPLAAGQPYTIPFQLAVPWEMAVSELYGRAVPGVSVGVRTSLKVAKALGSGDMDDVTIHPLPSQQRVLDALGHLGFRVRAAVVENGQLGGVAQQLPFHQEIKFQPPSGYTGLLSEVALAFVAAPQGLAIALEAEERGGFLHPGPDSFGRFTATHEQAMQIPWEQQFTAWLQAVVARRQAQQPYGQPGYGQPGYGAPGYGGPGVPAGPGRGGPGWGTVAAAGAAGLVGGLIAGEAIGLAADAVEGGFDLAGDAVEGGADLVGDGFDAVGEGLDDLDEGIGDFFD